MPWSSRCLCPRHFSGGSQTTKYNELSYLPKCASLCWHFQQCNDLSCWFLQLSLSILRISGFIYSYSWLMPVAKQTYTAKHMYGTYIDSHCLSFPPSCLLPLSLGRQAFRLHYFEHKQYLWVQEHMHKKRSTEYAWRRNFTEVGLVCQNCVPSGSCGDTGSFSGRVKLNAQAGSELSQQQMVYLNSDNVPGEVTQSSGVLFALPTQVCKHNMTGTLSIMHS